MLKLIIRVLFLIILGTVVYDIGQAGSFNKSQIYRFLREKGVIENGEICMKEAKKFYDKSVVWAEKNIPVYYNETCFHLKPYFNLGQDLFLVFSSSSISFIHHAEIYFNKHFPAFQSSVSILLENTISSIKEVALVLSQQLQNYAETAVQYANNIFSQR